MGFEIVENAFVERVDTVSLNVILAFRSLFLDFDGHGLLRKTFFKINNI